MQIKSLVICFLSVLIGSIAYAQTSNSITGTVVNGVDGKPLPFASVFLSQTTLGDRTTEQGTFTIRNIPNGKYELIVSYLGYEMLVVPVALQDSALRFQLRLQPKVGQLNEVVIRKDPNRERWLAIFKETFLGGSKAAGQCKIVNIDLLNIHYDEKERRLTASSDEALIIENNYLGYRVKYLLAGYVNDFPTRYVLYYGFPQFEEMKPRNSRQRRNWEENRLTAYRGSSMHFMRSLDARSLEAEGFDVHKLVRVERNNNTAKEPLDSAPHKLVDNRRVFGTQYANYLYTGKVSYDSIYHRKPDNSGLILHFKNYLQVVYKKEKESFEFASKEGHDRGYPQTSLIHLFTDTVPVDANGNVEMPTDLVYEGYWGWEKVAEMVPLDFKDVKAEK